MSGDDNTNQLRQQCDDWLKQRDRLLQAKTKARENYGAHFLLRPSAYDPECLAEPLRSMAMRALGYSEDQIAGTASRGTFNDFARKHTPGNTPSEPPEHFHYDL